MSREGSGAQTVCGIGIATELTGEDHEILQVYAIFEALDERLDRQLVGVYAERCGELASVALRARGGVARGHDRDADARGA